MTNKTTKICCTLALLASVAATPAFSQAKNFAGPSIAFNGSLNGSTSNYKDRVTVDGVTVATYDDKLGDISTSFGADLNYGFNLTNNFVLGVGVTYDFDKTKAGDTKLTFDGTPFAGQRASIKDHKSIYFQPTYVITPTSAVFAKFGYHEAKYKVTDVFDESGSANLNGWGYGFGLKNFLNESLFIQLEAQQINYGSESYKYLDETDGDGVRTIGTISVKPKINSAIISVGYKF